MKTFNDAVALDIQELELVSGGHFSSVLEGDPRQLGGVYNVQWSPAIVPHGTGRTGNAKPNGWTYDRLH